MANHFKRANEIFNRLSLPYGNYGNYIYLPFCADGSDSFNDSYSGGYSFQGTGDHVLKFTPVNTYNGNLILNLIAFVPALLEVNNGELTEILA